MLSIDNAVNTRKPRVSTGSCSCPRWDLNPHACIK
ncbi:SWIM zinc finger family protein [Bifidobacterium hapali]